MLKRRRLKREFEIGPEAGSAAGVGTGCILTGPVCGTPQLPDAQPPVAHESQVAGQMVCGTSRQTSYDSTRGTHLLTMRVQVCWISRGTQ